MSRDARRQRRAALLLLPLALLVAAALAATPPSAAERERAAAIHREAIGRLRDGARAAAVRNADAFAVALRDAAGRIEALIAAAPWLAEAERGALQQTAAGLRARADAGAQGYSPDADVAALERVGDRVRRGEGVALVFEGSFARSRTDEPVYGGHATAMGPPAMEAPTAAAGEVAEHGIRFEAVKGQLNEVTFAGGPSKLHLVESGGNGVALLDYDGDGRLDVYSVGGFELDERNGRARVAHRNALYRNLGGMRFQNVAAAAGVAAAAWGYGVCAGDYDGDGRLDLYVTNFGPNLLYRNKGDGTFEERAAAAGVQADGWSTGCAFLDADGDGDLDLYVARYVTASWDEVTAPGRFLMWRSVAKVMLGPAGLPGAADLFFENRGDGTLVEATDRFGLADTTKAYGFGVVAADFDGDGWTDIFVANDSNPNYLYRNRSGRGFESVGLLAGVAVNGEGRAQAGMGADASDFDGDGRIDLAVAAFAFDHDSLYRNLGGGAFEDVSSAGGLAAATFRNMSWGVAFLDADLDSRPDLFFANGHLFPQVDEHPGLEESYAQKSQIFRNTGGRFVDVSATAGRGLAVPKCSRSVAVGDLDGDGDPDLVVSAVDEAPTLLENTQRTSHHWVGIEVKQRGANAFAIGARVSVEDAGHRRQVREVRSGGGYLSHSDLRALFGLGSTASPVSVEVQLLARRWRFPGVSVDRHTTLALDEAHLVRP